jgi:16S rRNA (uracil1498-N3)-methyltransferase
LVVFTNDNLRSYKFCAQPLTLTLSQKAEGEKKNMTRRRFYATPSHFAPDKNSLTLSAEETRHARDVLRLQSGDEIYVFDGLGREFQCSVQTISRTAAEVSVIAEVEPARPESPLDLTLAIALLKGEKFDLVIQKATELGVKRIVPLDTERGDVRLRDGDSAQKRLTRWRRIALEAAKQTGRAYLPEISEPLALRELLTSACENKLMFSEREGESLSEAMTGVDPEATKVIALVGPEGGWTDNEIALARKSAWEIVTLGGRTLRAETAGITVVALLQHRFGDLV